MITLNFKQNPDRAAASNHDKMFSIRSYVYCGPCLSRNDLAKSRGQPAVAVILMAV